MKIAYTFGGLVVIFCGIGSLMCENIEVGMGFLLIGTIISIAGANNENTDSSTNDDNS